VELKYALPTVGSNSVSSHNHPIVELKLKRLFTTVIRL